MIKFLNGSLVVSDSVRWAPVVHFDQHLGTVHSKRWLKYVFSLFVVQKMKKARNYTQNLVKKLFFFQFVPECWSRVLFTECQREALYLTRQKGRAEIGTLTAFVLHS